MKTKPLPCPFCGQRPTFSHIVDHGPEIPEPFWSLGCPGRPRECNSLPSVSGDTKAQALSLWNQRKPKSWIQCNLNDQVRFKLKPKGRDYIRHLNATHPVYTQVPLTYAAADLDTWHEIPLWDFANLFGPTLNMGFDQVVETSIELQISN